MERATGTLESHSVCALTISLLKVAQRASKMMYIQTNLTEAFLWHLKMNRGESAETQFGYVSARLEQSVQHFREMRQFPFSKAPVVACHLLAISAQVNLL